jgi:hypothetical protein
MPVPRFRADLTVGATKQVLTTWRFAHIATIDSHVRLRHLNLDPHSP